MLGSYTLWRGNKNVLTNKMAIAAMHIPKIVSIILTTLHGILFYVIFSVVFDAYSHTDIKCINFIEQLQYA